MSLCHTAVEQTQPEVEMVSVAEAQNPLPQVEMVSVAVAQNPLPEMEMATVVAARQMHPEMEMVSPSYGYARACSFVVIACIGVWSMAMSVLFILRCFV